VAEPDGEPDHGSDLAEQALQEGEASSNNASTAVTLAVT
jgi:hypothetical protein